MSDTTALGGPDLTAGVPLTDLADGAMLAGQVNGEAVLLARRDDEYFAIGATCTHYGGPLAEGLIVADTVRCPWHHACFDLRNGEPLRAPALDPVTRWRVELHDGKAYVREKLERVAPPPLPERPDMPRSIVIIGGGGAGNAAAEMLRREGFTGSITMLSADTALPVDRPNLSKGYLSGAAPAESNPLRSPEFYRDQRIDLKLRARVTAIDTANRSVQLEDGTRYEYDKLLIATGAEPIRLDIPGTDLPHVCYLRTLDDGLALAEKAKTAKTAVVMGASFIGMEVAASLRARDVAVHIVAPDAVPMERVMGNQIGTFMRRLHEKNGVTFHLGTVATAIDERSVTLKNGEVIETDLVVIGVGVRPRLELAEQAGLAIDRGVKVNEYLETSVSGIYAAGDIARWPDPHTGDDIRVEHWVVAERQGQTAARNMLGQREPFDSVPFFWTDQYDLNLAYVGHAEEFDKVEMDGQLDIDERDCTVTFSRNGRKLAVATVYRDLESLRTEVEFEKALTETVP